MVMASSKSNGSKSLKIPHKGDILSTNAEESVEAISRALTDNPEATDIQVDLRTARMIDSVGLNVLIGLIKQTRDRPATVTLRISSPSIKRLFDVSHIHELAEVDYSPRRQR